MNYLGATILGTGSYLPADRRPNTWWTDGVVSKWTRPGERRALTSGQVDRSTALPPSKALVARHLAEGRGNPFHGIAERRIVDSEASVASLSIAAGRKALESAKLDPAEIDLLVDYSIPAEVAWPNNTGLIQKELGLRCMSFAVDTACTSFLTALDVAAHYVAAGTARKVLVTMGLGHTRLADPDDPGSVTLGDGAGAVVVGATSPGRGLTSSLARTDGRFHGTVGVTPNEGRWYEGRGPSYLRTLKMVQGMESVLNGAEWAGETIGTLLSRNGLAAPDVNWFFAHQPMPWFNAMCREAAGLVNARTVDSYSWLGSMGAANIPVNLDIAVHEKEVRDGDIVLFYSAGLGFNWIATVMQWGRA